MVTSFFLFSMTSVFFIIRRIWASVPVPILIFSFVRFSIPLAFLSFLSISLLFLCLPVFLVFFIFVFVHFPLICTRMLSFKFTIFYYSYVLKLKLNCQQQNMSLGSINKKTPHTICLLQFFVLKQCTLCLTVIYMLLHSTTFSRKISYTFSSVSYELDSLTIASLFPLDT